MSDVPLGEQTADGSPGQQSEAEKSAGIYAWEYFKYHAGQRQAVFRFYLLLVGAATLAYGYSLRAGAESVGGVKYYTGTVYIVSSLLFWRLDRRSSHLIKLAERALKDLEARLAIRSNVPRLRVMELGDIREFERLPWRKFETFRQVYNWIFLVVGTLGAFIINPYLGFLAIVVATWCATKI